MAANGFGTAFSNIQLEDVLDDKTLQLMSHFQVLGIAIIGASFLAVVGWRWLMISVTAIDTPGLEGKVWDVRSTGRIAAIAMMVTIYGVVAEPVLQAMQKMERGVNQGTKEYEEIQKLKAKLEAEEAANGLEGCPSYANYIKAFGDDPSMKKAAENYFQGIINEGGTPEQACQGLGELMNFLQNGMNPELGTWETLKIICRFLISGEIFALMLYILVGLIAKIVKFMMFSVVFYTLKILIVLGPLAWAFSIFDFSKDQWKVHLHYCLNTAFIFVIFALIDDFVLFNNYYLSASFLPMSDDQAWGQIGFDLAVVGLYMGAGKLASVVIGKDIASGISGAATGVAGMAVGAAAMGLGAAAGGAAAGAKGAVKGAKAMRGSGQTASKMGGNTK